MVPLDTACLSAETYPLALVTITSRTVGEIMFLAVGLILTNAEGDQCQLTFMGLWCGEKRTVTAGNSASHPLTYLPPSPNPVRPLSCKRHHPGRGVEGMCKLNHVRVRAPLPLPSNVVFLMFVFD